MKGPFGKMSSFWRGKESTIGTMKAFRFSQFYREKNSSFVVQGALAAVPKNYKHKVNCIGYNLDTSQPGAIFEEDARSILEKAIRGISEPVSGKSVNDDIEINSIQYT